MSAFRCTRPDVVEAVEDYFAEWNAWRQWVLSMCDELSPDGQKREPVVLTPQETFIGFTPLRSDYTAIPNGWRIQRNSSWDALVPRRQTREGKALAARFAERPAPNDVTRTLPGMPSELWLPSGGFSQRIYRPQVACRDGAVWVKWHDGLDPADRVGDNMRFGDDLDLTIWEKVPTSAWHLMVEAAKADSTAGSASVSEGPS